MRPRVSPPKNSDYSEKPCNLGYLLLPFSPFTPFRRFLFMADVLHHFEPAPYVVS